VRTVSAAEYTRVIIDLSKQVQYDVRRATEDPINGLPPRIYVDIHGAKLALGKDPVPGGDGVLRQVRVGQFTENIVRVVLDMNRSSDHRAFVLADPFRLVVDVKGQNPEGAAAAPTKKPVPEIASDRKRPAPRPTGIRKIVLDPGHGGKDPGAVGAGGIAEKDLVLIIAKKLAVKLKREMGVEVILTRTDDSFIPLEGRTAIANAQEADLFISLHMNASPNADARGLETYYLDKTTDEASIRLAARENSTSRKNVSDLQFILSDMMQSMKLEDSISLAHRLQTALVGGMSRKIDEVRDLGVKKALFYVLVGARMPSVLVEMLFITNKTEGQAMTQESHQDAMADALFEGIAKYNESSMAMKTL
jgi:N-acetylmuramoyl-L-alanine amidase